jgi:hypothetical protein
MSHKAVGRMIRELCGELPFYAAAPAFVEVLGWEKDGKRYFAAINQQEAAPIAPMPGVEIKFPYAVKTARNVETREELLIRTEDCGSVVQLPVLHVFQIIEVE